MTAYYAVHVHGEMLTWCLCVFVIVSRFGRAVDAYCGLCIAIVNTLYFSVVKGALSIFNCVTNQRGVSVLVAHPSEVCGKVETVR